MCRSAIGTCNHGSWYLLSLQWYCLLLICILTIWIASHVADRNPVGTFIVERFSHDDTTP